MNEFISRDGKALDYESTMHTIEIVVKRNARKYVFGSYTVEDIEQEARIRAIDGISRYDSDKPLENFLQKHVKNRLHNLRRDKFYRCEPSCKICGVAESPATGCQPETGSFCKSHLRWKKNNSNKAGLANPGAIIDETIPEKLSTFKFDADMQEVIDMRLSITMRGVLLRVRAGVRVDPHEKKHLITTMRNILNREDNEPGT